jgi:DNA-binding CsgD family transcriptional regulator
MVSADLHPRGKGMGLTLVEHAAAVLYNGLGRYQEACEAAQRGAAHPQELAFANWCLVQLVEAAARSGQDDLARDALRRLAATTAPSGTDWARGIEARSGALLARAHLLYGEWLRRDGRRVGAREQLRTAHEMFTGMGMHAFAARAARELLATGERTRRHVVESRDDLTPQEAHIARLARDGLSNPEIGARLYLSPRTVEWHLSHVFDKLGVRSRRQLRDALVRSGVPA